MLFAFGDFELDVALCELRRMGQRVPLQPKVLDTLRYLIEHRDHVVTKQELLDALWGGQHLNAVAVPWSVSHARRALGQKGNAALPIETIRGRGYRFVAAVRAVIEASEASAPAERDAHGGEEAAWPNRADPFLGREEVIQQLLSAVTAARAGNGGLCLLTGEAGIGKTRCAAELTRLARGAGIPVWNGRCIEAGGAPAFWPWIQILREAAPDEHVSAPLAREAEALLRLLVPTEVGATDPARLPKLISPEASRFWLLERLCRFLAQATVDRCRVLVLDDLHCADEGSLEALALLSGELLQTKLLVVGTARDTPPCTDAGREKLLTEHLRRFIHIPLSGLAPADIASYLRHVTGDAGTPALVLAVHAKTAGNPLFLREAASWVAAQRTEKGDVRPEDVLLPELARGFLRDRLATLDERTRSILDAACVIGDEFDLSVLSRVTGFATGELLAGLDGAIRARFVVRQKDPAKYAFLHGLMREVLYDALSNVRRVGWHGEIAVALEALALMEPRLSELAYHFYHALPAHHHRAMRYCRLAGNASLRVFAFREAAQFFSWALTAQQCASQVDARTTCELLLASAVALRRPGRVGESLKQCRQALELARREGLADLIVEAAGLMRPTVSMAQLPDPLVLDALNHALTLLPPDEKALRAHTYARLSCIPPHSEHVEKSRELSEQAVALARETGRRELLLEALGSRFHGLSGPDHLDELLDVTDEVLRLDAPAVSWWSGDAFVTRYYALLQRGDMLGADRALEAFGQTARELRIGEAIWHYERFRAQQRFQAGDFAYAEARFEELARKSDELSLGYGPLFYGAQLDALSVERFGKSLPSRFDQTDPARKMVEVVPSYRAERILFLIEGGRFSEARVAFVALAKDDFGIVTRNGAYLYTLAKLALVATALSDTKMARALYERLCPYPTCNPANGFTFCLGSVAYFLGALAGFLGRHVEAEGHFEEALAMNERLGYEPHVLRTELALAQMLLRTPSRARRERARRLLCDVGQRAQSFGMAALVAQSMNIEGTARIEIRASVSDRLGRVRGKAHTP